MPTPAPTERLASIVHDATRDPAAMTPDERRREIAAILARGVLRLRESVQNAHGSGPQRTPEKSAESAGKPLMKGQERSFMCPA